MTMADEFDAEVIASFGRHLLVRDAAGGQRRARPSGRKLDIVCGDRVRCEFDRAHDEVLVVEVLPRRTLLARSSLRGASEAVVANITQLVVVIAPLPQPDFFIVDRYLCAATSAGLRGAIAVNKADLAGDAVDAGEMSAYTHAGYIPVACSAKSGSGLAKLEGVLANSVSVLVGQSGVGKSSLVNALLLELSSSSSRFTSAALRPAVPLNTMCSRKWLTPETSSHSSRAPVFTKNAYAAEYACGFTSATISRPFPRV